ncbi:PD-(D/E)XK nuclease family protein [Saccharothrix obliqua]|uniref:PD-(D/E)XK nuclease family protein n=1 Tax=Saccharothrix obliqua TaxID=2861747 RepID=UPI001C5DF683|nr:PD-(D/E)XK nuclease family protein [Saccharothrix obliqua]MBW4720342.1 PD-(D/E)XK nuclease family protein [Saccharothrix obliqua]
MGEALKARHGLVPTAPRARREPLNDFPLGPFMDALDLIEFRGVPEDDAVKAALAPSNGRRSHDGVGEWTRHVVRGYLGTAPRGDWLPIRDRWALDTTLERPDTRGVRKYRIDAWGRRYRSTDGSTHELRLIGFSSGRRGPGELAVAGLVAASTTPAPQRVRLSEFAGADGTSTLLYDKATDEVHEFYREHGRAALRAAVDGTDYRPGSPCVSCRFRVGCPALKQAPGALGPVERGAARRTWSVTNARKYTACAARDHLIRQRLPVEWSIERSAWAERGRAVHAYLQQRHREGSPCTPDVPDTWPDRVLPEKELALGTRMLRNHAELCPLPHHPDEVRVEPKLVLDDTTADVVVLVTPDLLYRDGGSLVWRELKTTTADPATRFRTLAGIPQLALAIVLLGRGALGDTGPHPRAELEILHPDGNDLRFYDVSDPAVRAEAAEVVSALATPWHRDVTFTASPGSACRTCEVRRWCAPGRAEAAR